MNRLTTIGIFYLAVFLQAGAYGLTFLLPRLFADFGANEKVVGAMLFATTLSTLLTVYYSGHLSDRFGRLFALALACVAIALALAFYGLANTVGVLLIAASLLLGFGWGLTYALGPIVLTRLVTADQRVRYFTLLSIAVMGGFGLSPVLASVLEKSGFEIRDAFFVTAAFCAISAVIFYGLITPVRRHSLDDGKTEKSRLSIMAMRKIGTTPARLPIFMVFLGASVFAGMNNFQTVFADNRGLDYSHFFIIYTVTVVVFRFVLARFTGGQNPYRVIACLQYVMCASVILFLISAGNLPLYWMVAFLFGIGYGVSYPILAAMAANDADEDYLAQSLQLFALTYFIGIFGFPLIAGWLIVEWGTVPLLILVAALAAIEASLALIRSNRVAHSL